MSRQFRIERGMSVVDENDNPVGSIQNIYAENESGASRFIIVEGHLLPVETIEEVDGGRARVGMTHERVRSFPQHAPGSMPSREDQRVAYEMIGLQGPAVERD